MIDTFFTSMITKVLSLILLAVFFLIDNLVVAKALRENKNLNNKYFNWHKNTGLLKFTVLKTVFIIVVIYFIFNPPMRDCDPLIASWLYCTAVLVMSFKYMRSKTS